MLGNVGRRFFPRFPLRRSPSLLALLLGMLTTISVAWAAANLYAALPMPVAPKVVAGGSWPGWVPRGWPSWESLEQNPGFRAEGMRDFGLGLVNEQKFAYSPNSGESYSSGRLAAGFPFAAVSMDYASSQAPGTVVVVVNPPDWPRGGLVGTSRVLLPVMPRWLGLVLDTALYAGVWWGLWRVWRGARRARRVRAGKCAGCGYDRAGIGEGACPECGEVPRRGVGDVEVRPRLRGGEVNQG